MEIFFSVKTDGRYCILCEDEATHCVKVMRHKKGDEICVVDVWYLSLFPAGEVIITILH